MIKFKIEKHIFKSVKICKSFNWIVNLQINLDIFVIRCGIFEIERTRKNRQFVSSSKEFPCPKRNLLKETFPRGLFG